MPLSVHARAGGVGAAVPEADIAAPSPRTGDLPMPGQPHRITVIPGDGVGLEVVRSAQRIIAAAGVAIDWEEAEAGAEVFKRGDTSGVPQATRESIEGTRVVLKGPLETPVGFGEKSANVTLRKLLFLGNVLIAIDGMLI